MKRKYIYLISSAALLVISVIITYIITNSNDQYSNSEFYIKYPFQNALFPPEFPAPVIEWADTIKEIHEWEVEMYLKNRKYLIKSISYQKKWRPDKMQWDSLKKLSDNKSIVIKISRSGNTLNKKAIAINIKISKDKVGAPILYRDIPLPFTFAEKNLDSMSYRLVNVGSENSPYYAMKKFMVCGNCHSFSADGKTIGLDFDAARRDKGGYFITEIRDTITFDTSNFLSWTKLQNRKTFGTFSKLSPDGRYVVTTIKDRAIHRTFGYSVKEIYYSQFFFLVNGVLAVYDRVTKKLQELPGASDEEYVQTNAFWTPDGKNIIFARAKALPRKKSEDELTVDDETLIDEFINRKRNFKFDIYIVPFNNGKGGISKPIKGASENNKSNYFPAVSPDGKWLVFCQAENFMLLMPDSKLYIMPLKGGKPKKLKCNFREMNSWHAWSPNSKWIVYVSKALGPYTDLFLTHIDQNGNASVPVLIEKARNRNHAANYPEFLNVNADYTFDMIYNYIDLSHIKRALIANNTVLANELLNKFLAQQQIVLPEDYFAISSIYYKLGNHAEAIKYDSIAKAKTNKKPELKNIK